MPRNTARPLVSHTTLTTLTKSIIAISLSVAGIAHASEYSSVTFFGDSLTDGGYFSPITQGVLMKPESGQFTTNPNNTWATSFAEQLGTKSVANTFNGEKNGNNYAIGGARAGTDVINDKFGFDIPVASVNKQANNYLTNNRVDPNGLYVVWAGANDLLAVTEDPASAQSIIGSAIGDQIATVTALRNNGANYILVPNIPDVGLTPDFIPDPTLEGDDLIDALTAQATVTAITNNYNQAMLNGIASTGANIIPLDTFSLLQQVAANPSAYGFTNMTDKACDTASSLTCGPTNLITPDANETYFFADGIHPTGRAHQLIADYANAVVTAPSQISVLPHIATKVGLATNERLQSHVNQVQNSEQKPARSLWATGEIENQDIAGFESDGHAQVLLGVDFAHANLANAVTGVYGNITRKDFDNSNISSGLSEIGIDELGFGVYHTNTLEQFGGVQLNGNGAIGFGSMDVDVTRTVNLGGNRQSFDSDADGKRYYATLQAGYPMQVNNIAFTPYLGANVNRVKIDALEEQEVSGIAMQFDKQKYNTTYGKLGIKFNSPLVDNLNLFGDLHYQKRLSDDRDAVSARLNTIQSISFETPTIDTDDDNFGVTLGVSRNFGLINANAGITHSPGDDDDSTSVFFGLSGAF